jgi:hypothetical protein
MGQLEASSSSRQRELRNRRQAADGRKAETGGRRPTAEKPQNAKEELRQATGGRRGGTIRAT